MSFSDLTFASPLWLWGLWAVPALAALLYWAERQTERKLAVLMRSPRLRAQLTGAASPIRRRGRYALMLLGLTGLLLAMAGPRLGYEAQQIRRKGLDLILMVDVSKSMLATDLTPNRLIRAKLAAQDIIGQLQGDRVGLVAFAGSAFLQAPLTVDYDAVLTAVRDLDIDTIPRGGTNLEAAINLAIDAFGKAEADNRAIVILSDGESTEGERDSGLKAAARAAETGIKIFTAGLGTTDGSLLPLPGGNGEFVRDREGQMVRSKLDEAGLEAIAKAAGGFYIHLQNGQAEMRAIVEKGFRQMKLGDIDAKDARRPLERYQWPLGAALLSLALAALIGERRKARAPASGVAASVVAAAPSARRPAAAVAVGLALGFIGLFGHAQAAPAPPPGKDPMALYRDGHYNEAYQGFKDLAKTNPDADRLHFDAGASAFMGGKYDDALNAFGEAMTSKNPDLQAMSHYNFGNTLFKRGSAQKDRQVKIQDWRSAIEHYDSTLKLLQTNKNEPLAQDTAYNRDLVLKMLEEEEKPQPTPPPQDQQQQQKQDQKQSKSKQDQQQQKQQQKQDQKQDQKDSQDQKQNSQQQEQGKSDQQRQQQQSKSDQQGSAQPNQQEGNSNAPPKQQDPSGQSKEQKKDDSSPQGGKSDAAQKPPQKPSDKGEQSNNPPPPEPGADAPSFNNQQPDPSSVPNQDQPRQRGDFKAQPGEKPSEEKGGQMAQEAGEAGEPDKPEEGKMNAAQARALLEALKGEDDHVSLNDHADRRDEPAMNDW